jgi:OHCU decarboxylase
MTLTDLNTMPHDEAVAEFGRCCGSRTWAQKMAERRPFENIDRMTAEADRIWSVLAPGDWLEAFGAHPRIGERATSAWSHQEQAGAASAGADVRARLAEGNRRYEERFGYTFLICATGKSAEQMLSALQIRLRNEAAAELTVAAEEQRQITDLRLRKLISS